MENYKLSDLDIKKEHIKGTKYDELTIDYPDSENDEIKYRFEGISDYKMLDFFNVLIFEYEDPYNKTSPQVTIFSRLDQGHRVVSFPVLNKWPTVTEELRKIKKLIIPYFNSYLVYSYEYGIVTSARYDSMTYDEETQTFQVSLKRLTSYGYVTLFGVLDSEGHLIDDTLFIPELDLELVVDEHNLEASIDTCLTKIEKKIEKRERQEKIHEYNEWEYQQYLKRKRKNGLD